MVHLGHRETVVIGGGIVGAAIAWGLARSGVKPLVLDGEDLALRASRANFALVWVQGKGLGYPDYALWTLRSAQMWPTIAESLLAETAIDVDLKQPGGYSFCLSAQELEQARAIMDAIDRETAGKAGDYEVLDRNALFERVPLIGPQVHGAIFGKHDGHLNSLRLFRAFHAGMLGRGAEYRANHIVEVIEPAGWGFRLIGAWGEVRCDRVVIAAGLDSERLAPMVGLLAPLVHSKGQIIVTEKCQPFFAYPSGTIRQTDEGGVMIGDSEDEHSTSLETDQGISAVLADRAIRTFPRLAALNVVRTWSGFRVQTGDGMPVYAQSETHPGAFLAVCHSGVTLAAAHVLDVAPQIAAGSLDALLASFSCRRFHVS